MKEYSDIEKRRLLMQNSLDSQKSQKERNILGQFATPSDLSNQIVKYCLDKIIPKNIKIHFLDPAFGTGSFFSAMINNIDNIERISNVKGIEIDKELANVARELWSEYGLDILTADYTNISPPKNIEALPNLILTNPPYVRHHHLNQYLKNRLRKCVNERLGYNVNGLMGLYGYFLLISHSWLRKGGFGVWLIPSEFMDVNYGKIIKHYLSNDVKLIQIHRYNFEETQFEDALVSSSVVIFQKEKVLKNHNILFTYGKSISNPIISNIVTKAEIVEHPKWTHFFQKYSKRNNNEFQGAIKLRDIFKITRGIATGYNKYFIMNRKKASSLNIPNEFLIPVIPPPRILKQNVIEADVDGYPRLDDQLVLLSCDIPEDTIKNMYPRLYEYFESGKKNGVTERYLVKKRKPWYKQEYREPAPFLCTYMGRSSKEKKPFKFIWNKSKAITTNVYLLLYPKREFSDILKRDPKLYPIILKSLNSIEKSDMIGNGRSYGGGLYKIEPKELGNINISNLSALFNIKKQNERY